MENILKSNHGISVMVSLDDLKEAAKEFANELMSKFKSCLNKDGIVVFMTTDEVCKFLNVTRPTLWRWNKEGYLTHIHVGRKVIYNRDDVERLARK